MLYQQGAHNGSNMGTRMHSYPIYQEYSEARRAAGRGAVPAADRGVGQHRQPDRAARRRDGVGQLFLDARRAAARSGRVFNSQEDDRVYKGHPVVVLSYDYWVRRFARDPGVDRQEDPGQQLPDDHRRRVGGGIRRARSGALAADPRADPDEAG